MKERVLIKKNVFTCVTFGAIFLFVLCESLFKTESLSIIAFIITIPIFLLSFIKLFIDVLEDLNDKITSFLSTVESWDVPSGQDYYEIRNTREENLDNVIHDISDKYPNSCDIDTDLKKYFYAHKTRKSIRTFRRGMLYIYYTIFMIILLLLLLHTELYIFFENNSWLSTINMDLFSVWSLIIILLEIMMKDIVEDVINYIIYKILDIELEYY